jgi:hypothetical protein
MNTRIVIPTDINTLIGLHETIRTDPQLLDIVKERHDIVKLAKPTIKNYDKTLNYTLSEHQKACLNFLDHQYETRLKQIYAHYMYEPTEAEKLLKGK